MYPTWKNSPRAASSYLPTSSTPATSDPSTAHSHGVVWVADYPGVVGGHAGQAYGVERAGDARAMGSASFASQDGTLSHSGLLAGYGHGQGRDQTDRMWQAERQQQAGANHSISYPSTSASFIPYDMRDNPSNQYTPPVSAPSYSGGYAMPTAPHPSWRQQPQPEVAAGAYASTPAASGQYADNCGNHAQQSSKRPRTGEGPPRDIRWHLQNAAIPSLQITTSLPTSTAGVPHPSPVRQRLSSHSLGDSGGLKPTPAASSSEISPVSSMSSGPSIAAASGLPAYEPHPSLTTSDKTSPATFVLPIPRSDETPATSLPPSTSSSASVPSAPSASLALSPQIHPAQVPSPQPAQAKADKSCAPCRTRKVRCTRTWPKCARCIERRLDCGYGGLVPIDVVKQMHPESRVLELEARIKSLESELVNAQHASVSPSNGFNGLSLASDLPFEIYTRLFGYPQLAHNLAGPSALFSFDEETDVVETALGRAHVDAVCSAVQRRAAETKGLPKLEEGEADSEIGWWRSVVARDAEMVDGVAALGALERSRHVDWVRWVVWALLDAFWATCSSNVPTFRPFHPPTRKLHFYLSLSSLTACERAVLTAFLSIGIRSTDDVALLGIASEFSPAEEGRKREELARVMRSLMYELYERAEVGFGEGSEAGLQTGLVVGVVSMWNELLPRRTRSIVRTSLGVYKDLFDSAPTTEARQSLQMMYTLPLLHQDSTVAAYLRSSPLISDQDLATYFPAFPVPVFGRAEQEQPVLMDELSKWLDLDRLGGATHLQHTLGSMVIYRWLSACLRWCAEMSCSKGASRHLPVASVDYLLSTLSSLHAYIQTLQHYLTHLAPASAAHPSCLGPDGDTCQDVHLRWATRLDREIDDATWLAFSVVGERLVREDQRLAKMEMEDGEGGHAEAWHEDIDIETLKMCETRVRKGLKLAACFFANSPDPHQTHHLAWSLELIPSWTFLATQRYASPSASPVMSDPLALRDKATELTERELDWIERGLDLAQRYHPVADRRLNELRMYREANQTRVGPRAVVAAAAVQVGEKERSFRAAMKAAVKQAVPAWG
uniref:BY PROTMAP: gi/472588063/gb/EMS25559.1/ binuclear zinc transcription factor [Rhodosporidium toruloides NP11] gi/647401434/emb/CDR47665.1/ RHTO0S15e00386g1_1 [Rhodosporidium toruloides] n=1 Tax=Rhodotorula toruloides TaxID=5286 RepID=A0A0K3CI30_RHOTO